MTFMMMRSVVTSFLIVVLMMTAVRSSHGFSTKRNTRLFGNHAKQRASPRGCLLVSTTALWQSSNAEKRPSSSSLKTRRPKTETPPKLLPPLLSDVIHMLPPPFSDVTPGTILAQVRGTYATNPMVRGLVHGLGLVTLGFYAFLRAMVAVWWPMYERMAVHNKFSPFQAFFLTGNLVLGSVAMLAPFLLLPMVVPTSSEFKKVSKKNIRNLLDLFKPWTFKLLTVVGAVFPFLLIRGFTPATLWQTKFLPPSVRFWPLAKQSLFFAFFTESLYYCMHRIMHWKNSRNPIIKWLVKVHKPHHRADAQNMSPYDATRLHLVEQLLTISSILAGPLLWKGAHPFVSLCFFGYMFMNAFISHTGYISHDGSAHTLHHQRSNCNYGLLGLWDYIFKTSRTKSVDLLFSVARVQRQMKRKVTREELDDIVGTVSSSIKMRAFGPNETVVHFGDPGDCFFILEEGSCSAAIPNIQDGTERTVKVFTEPGEFFGELALLRNQPRMATIKAGEFGAKLAEVSDPQFSLLSDMSAAFEQQAALYSNEQDTITDISSSKEDLPEYSQVGAISGVMPQEDFEPGETIIQQGEPGDRMYILEEGTCSAVIDGKEVFNYEKAGDYFGELALLNNDPRKASVIAGDTGATVAVVTRPVFDNIVTLSESSQMRQRAQERYSLKD